MIKKIILIAVFSILTPSLTHASVITLLTSDAELKPGHPNQGWFSNNHFPEIFPITPGILDSYTVGWAGAARERDYFSFFIPDIDEEITSATLNLQRGGATSNAEESGLIYHLGSVTTDALTLSQNKGTSPNLAIYSDLGSGQSYGDFPISNSTIPGDWVADYYDILSFDLNIAAIQDINLNRGDYFSIGGSLRSTVFDESKPLIGGIVLFYGVYDFLNGPQQLVLTIDDPHPVPEPATVSLLTLGLSGLLLRRKRNVASSLDTSRGRHDLTKL